MLPRMLFCLASGAAFGAMAVFGKLAYGEGATVGTLLTLRFVLAAGIFWAGGAGRSLPRARDALPALGLGAGGYALQAGCYFAALERIDASLLSLLVYTFPALVAVGAFALGRERLDRRRAFALALATGGAVVRVGRRPGRRASPLAPGTGGPVLVVAGAGAGALDPLGAALGLLTALLY